MTSRRGGHFPWVGLALFALALVVLWPTDAMAWGPLAHLGFSSGALEADTLFSPATRLVLHRFSSEFLYGSLAADIVVGKNLSRYAVHCHNWTVGFQVLDRARGDAQKSFALGFLAHLAADTVAHNYYVPYKTVQGFRRRASGHAYWELRFDQRQTPDLWKLARHVSRAEYREHDEHLEEVLGKSHVIPFSISKKLFGSLLVAARLKRWQGMSAMVAGERDLPLHQEEVRECHNLAVDQIVGLLKNGAGAACTGADPTGGRNLHLAAHLRQSLRGRSELDERLAAEVVRKARPAFKTGIFGRVHLPEVPDTLLEPIE
ncbi:MAG: zinc dependent phospholipase C family protein [Myxococcaceae bacterium]